MVERTEGQNGDSQIAQEKEVLAREEDFFASHEPGNYVGILTNYDISTVSRLYPEIIEGIQLFYGFVEQDETDPASEQSFINRHFRNQYATGRLLKNDEVIQIREDMSAGQYSEQYEIYRRRQISLSTSQKRERGRNQRFESYKALGKDEDVVFNKRACLARIQGLRSDLSALYGEVNYKQALLAELLLSAPFSSGAAMEIEVDDAGDETVPLPSAPVNKDVLESQKAYFDEAIGFVKSLDLDKRVEIFEDQSEKYPVRWTPESSDFNIPPFDKKYISQVYELAGKMLGGDYSLDEVHSLLSQTILRRGKVFKVVIHKTALGGIETQIVPEELKPASFEDIAGYDDQKNFLRALIAKTGASNPTLNEMRIIISAGKPGLGKSLGVRAFLSNLPENARGLILNLNPNASRTGDMVDIKSVARIAAHHPDLHIFAIVEDIDAVSGDRLHSASTSELLKIDSIGSDLYPPNLHIFATTNRPDVIDAAVTRPGRTAKILVYQEPSIEERKKVAKYHAQANNYELSDEIVDAFAKKVESFSPDEIRYIFWSLRFADVETPTMKDLEHYIADVKARRKIEIEAKGKPTGLKN